MKYLRFIFLLHIGFTQFVANGQQANLVISSSPKFTVHKNKENGRHFISGEFNVKNIGSEPARFLGNGPFINVLYSLSKDSSLNNDTITFSSIFERHSILSKLIRDPSLDIINISGSPRPDSIYVPENFSFLLPPGQTRRVNCSNMYLPNVDFKNIYRYLIIHINPEITPDLAAIAFRIDEKRNDNVKIFLHKMQPVQEYAVDLPDNIGVAGPALYPDLKLTVSDISSSIQTEEGTNTKYKEYKFTCSVTNNSNVTAAIDSVHSLTIRSWRVATCKSATLSGAGGQKVPANITMIKPYETIVLENQTARQPVNATTKIRVELIYKAKETDLLNNKVCITQ